MENESPLTGGRGGGGSSGAAGQSRKRRRFGNAVTAAGRRGVGGVGGLKLDHNPSLSHILETFTQLQVFQRKGLLCDLVLVPQDDDGVRRIPVHSCIMAASSLYIKAMLTGQLGKAPDRSQGPREVSLSFDYSTLSTLVNFAYGGGIEISGESVAALLAASDFLRMEEAVYACCQWLLQNLSSNNAFLVRELAIEYRQTDLMEAVSKFMLEHFEQIVHQPEFTSLHPTDLDVVLSSDDLVVHREMDVYQALMRWASVDPSGRRDDFVCLFLKHIRLEFFKAKELQTIIEEDSLASRSQQVAEMCREALLERTPPPSSSYSSRSSSPMSTPPRHFLLRSSSSSKSTATSLSRSDSSSSSSSSSSSTTSNAISFSRSSSSSSSSSISSSSSCSSSLSPLTTSCRNRRWKVDKSIYMLGGRSHDQTHLRKGRHYLAHKAMWSPVKEMNTPRAFLGVAAMDNLIYAVGGYNEQDSFLNTVEYYSPVNRSWQYAKRLNTARASLGLCTLEKKLMAVGGENRYPPDNAAAAAAAAEGGMGQTPVYLKSVEVYDKITNTWRMAGEMETPRSFIGLGQVDSSVFAIGGYDGEDYLQTVERYDSQQDRWMTVAPLNAPRSCCGVSTYKGNIYVAGGYNTDHCLRSVEMYDPRGNVWKNVAPLEVERSYLSMVEFNNSLYAIGGLDSQEHALSTAERYDPALDRWFEMPSLPSAVYAFGLCVVDEET